MWSLLRNLIGFVEYLYFHYQPTDQRWIILSFLSLHLFGSERIDPMSEHRDRAKNVVGNHPGQ